MLLPILENMWSGFCRGCIALVAYYIAGYLNQGGVFIGKNDLGRFFLDHHFAGLTNYVIQHNAEYSSIIM